MSGNAPDEDQDQQVDALYHKLSGREAYGPSEATRRAILAAAREVARTTREPSRRGPLLGLLHSCGRPAVFGTLAAGIVAALLLVPLRQTSPEAPGLRPPGPVPVEIHAETKLRAEPVLLPAAVNIPTMVARKQAFEEAAPTLSPPEPAVASASLQAAAPAPASLAAAAPAVPLSSRAEAAADASGGLTLGRPAPMPWGVAPAQGDAAVQLRHAAAGGDSARLAALVRVRAPVNARDAQGRTALMLAVMAHDAPSVRVLLEAGADPNSPDNEGLRPLQLAGADPEIARLLREHGAH